MSGFMIKLPEAVTDLTLPKLYADPIMSDGSLVLLDVGHSAGLVTGIPANNSKIINVAGDIAKILTGSAVLENMSPNVLNTLTSPSGTVERTAKKGIHVIYSKVGDANLLGWNIAFNADNDMKAYLLANASHDFFMSQWSRVTRAAGFDQMLSFMGLNKGFNDSILYNIRLNNNTLGLELGKRSTGHTALGQTGVMLRNLGFKNYKTAGSYTLPAVGSTNFFPFSAGRDNGYATANQGQYPSQVFYRYYLEDLTVSGRTYAEVDAIDNAMYTAAFAEGGKFYGDTFSDPATVLA